MAHFVTLNFQTKQGVKAVKIKPNWAGKGLAVHKPIVFNEDTHEAEFSKERGVWILSHVGSGLRAGISFGSLERAKKYAKEWDQEFAKLNPEKISAKFKKEWKLVADEMSRTPSKEETTKRTKKQKTIRVQLLTRQGENALEVAAHWIGKGLAIHKPVDFDRQANQYNPTKIRGYWRITHIATGLSAGTCFGSLDRAKSYAKKWDDKFAAIDPRMERLPEWHKEWCQVMKEMKQEPPRKPIGSRRLRALSCASTAATAA